MTRPTNTSASNNRNGRPVRDMLRLLNGRWTGDLRELKDAALQCRSALVCAGRFNWDGPQRACYARNLRFLAALQLARRAPAICGCCDAALFEWSSSMRAAIRFVAWTGLSDDYRGAVDGHSPWSRDAVDPQPICITDISDSNLPDALKATVKAEGIAAVAFIPLVMEGKLVGKFMAYYEAPHALSQAGIALAVTIARQLGFSIQRIRSDERRQHAEQTNRLLASIIETSDDAIVSKDPDRASTQRRKSHRRLSHRITC